MDVDDERPADVESLATGPHRRARRGDAGLVAA
jgi:hypothetical protein